MERGHAADIGLRGHGRIRFMSGRAPHRISETMVSQAEHGQWMSVAELATKRRISEGSAARLVRRRKRQRRTDPDNMMRILVPDMAADTPNRGRGPQPAIEVLRMAVESLTERLRRADEEIRRERERADTDIRIERERADRAEGVRDAALEAANRADAEAAAARGRLAEIEAADVARKAKPVLARVVAGLRGR
jgi:hypothetical protein